MKYNTIKLSFITLILTVLVGCGNNKKQPEIHTVSNGEATLPTGDLDVVSEKSEARFEQAALEVVYNDYLALKAALVNTDAVTTQKAAKTMLTGLKAVDTDGKAVVAATAIASNTDINKQRESFEVLTAATELFLKEAIASGEVYKQFCPMAFEGRGAHWLSDSKEIRNPYFGNKMLKCGLVKETFK